MMGTFSSPSLYFKGALKLSTVYLRARPLLFMVHLTWTLQKAVLDVLSVNLDLQINLKYVSSFPCIYI